MGKISVADKRSTAYVAAIGGHFEHVQQHCPSPSLHPHLSTNEPALFRATHILPKKNQRAISWKLDITFSQGSAAALCRWGGQINNFVLHIFSVYSVPNIVEIGQHM